jgi:hypothetical protein
VCVAWLLIGTRRDVRGLCAAPQARPGSRHGWGAAVLCRAGDVEAAQARLRRRRRERRRGWLVQAWLVVELPGALRVAWAAGCAAAVHRGESAAAAVRGVKALQLQQIAAGTAQLQQRAAGKALLRQCSPRLRGGQRSAGAVGCCGAVQCSAAPCRNDRL